MKSRFTHEICLHVEFGTMQMIDLNLKGASEVESLFHKNRKKWIIIGECEK